MRNGLFPTASLNRIFSGLYEKSHFQLIKRGTGGGAGGMEWSQRWRDSI